MLVYVGNFKEDLFHGNGRLIRTSPIKNNVLLEMFEGNYVDGVKKGVGKWKYITHRDQEIDLASVEYVEYVGDFNNDKPTGTGSQRIVRP